MITTIRALWLQVVLRGDHAPSDESKNAQMMCASTRFGVFFYFGQVALLFRVDQDHRTCIGDPATGVTILEGDGQNFGHLSWGRGRIEEDHASDTL